MDSGLRITSAEDSAPTAPPDITRRRLLQAGGAGLAVAMLGASAVAVADSDPGGTIRAATARGLRRSSYTSYVGHRFILTPPDHLTIPTRLAAIEDFAGAWARPLAGSEEAFILIFHAPAGAPRPGQAKMEVSGPGGSFGQFIISPAGPGRSGLDYAVAVNRVMPPGERHSV